MCVCVCDGGRGWRCVRACACARASGGVVVLVLYGEGAGWSGVAVVEGGGGLLTLRAAMRSLGSALNMELRGDGHFRLRCRLFARPTG